MAARSDTRQSVPKIPIKINETFLPLYDLETRYIENIGGRRSGKSVAISQLLTRRALEYPRRKVVCLRKVGRTLRFSVWPRLKSAVDEAVGLGRCRQNKTEMTLLLPGGSEFLCIGADDPEKLKSIEGVTDYWFEEATEFDERDLDTADAGLSTPAAWPNQIWLTHNPIPKIPGHEHWLERRFLRRELPIGKVVVDGSTAVLRTTYRQNAFCPPEVREVLEGYRETNPDLYRMWALGEFTTVEGVILDGWDIVNKVPSGVPFLGYGLDFGYANDPAALVAIWEHNDELYVREDLYSTGLTNQDIAERMGDLGISRSDIIRADSAEPKSIEEIKRLGFTVVPSLKGPDYKRAAANWLKSKRIHFIEGSTNLIREASTWSWDRDRHGNVLPRPADGDDHTIDAMIYGSYRKSRRWRPL